jgi:hypothetical protein
MDALATLELPAIGYGLRHDFGRFEQRIDAGQQLEGHDPGCTSATGDCRATTFARTSRASCEREGDFRRAAEEKMDTENISKVLYPNAQSEEGKELRLEQLPSAGVPRTQPGAAGGDRAQRLWPRFSAPQIGAKKQEGSAPSRTTPHQHVPIGPTLSRNGSTWQDQLNPYARSCNASLRASVGQSECDILHPLPGDERRRPERVRFFCGDIPYPELFNHSY